MDTRVETGDRCSLTYEPLSRKLHPPVSVYGSSVVKEPTEEGRGSQYFTV